MKPIRLATKVENKFIRDLELRIWTFTYGMHAGRVRKPGVVHVFDILAGAAVEEGLRGHWHVVVTARGAV